MYGKLRKVRGRGVTISLIYKLLFSFVPKFSRLVLFVFCIVFTSPQVVEWVVKFKEPCWPHVTFEWISSIMAPGTPAVHRGTTHFTHKLLRRCESPTEGRANRSSKCAHTRNT